MKNLALVLAGVGLIAFGGVRLVCADDPAPQGPAAPTLTAEEQTRVRHLIDDLGSDDFRIREAATKALTEFGEKARAALVEAQKNDNAEVRFRAEQLVRRLDGRNRNRRLDAPDAPGGAPGGAGQPPAGPGGGWWGPFGGNGQDESRLGEEIRRRMKEWEEEMNGLLGQGRGLWPQLGMGRALRLAVDGTEYVERGGKATLTIVEKDADGKATAKHAYEGKDLDDILAKNPELKDKPGVASLVEQVKKAHEARGKMPGLFGGLVPGQGPGFSYSTQTNGVQVEQTPGHVKVTITENGADGKPETKTYEGTDLEALKAEHPELKDKLGGIRLKVHVGPMGPGSGFGFGDSPFGKDSPLGDDWTKLPELKGLLEGDDEGSETGEMGDAGSLGPKTGPFGLQLGLVDEALRAQTGLEAGSGVLVRLVRPDSPAAKMGLQAFDVITAINGARVGTSEHVRNLIRDVKPDAALSIDVLRGGKATTLKR